MLLHTKSGKEIQVDNSFDSSLLDGGSITVTSHGYCAVMWSTGEKLPSGYYKYVRKYLHRMLTNAPKHLQVDHINGNKLDNRMINLRICTNKSNNRNKKAYKGKYKGVYFDKKRNKWCSQITKNRKVTTVGSCFETAELAALAYNKVAKKLHGKYAYQNTIVK